MFLSFHNSSRASAVRKHLGLSKPIWIGLTLLILLVAGAYLAMIFHLQPSRKEPILFNWFAWTDNESLIRSVTTIRLPRILAAVLVGAGLGIAGCLLQSLTSNDLADPEVMGINQGANMMIAALMVLMQFQTFHFFTVTASMLGTALSGILIYVLSVRSSFSSSSVVLTGLVNSLFFSSMTTTLIIFHDTDLYQLLRWMAGDLSGMSWEDVMFSLVTLVPVSILCCLFASQLNVLSMGEDTAISVGQRLTMVRSGIMVAIIVLVGAATAVCGPIGFIGLMAVHIIRTLTGIDYRVIVPLAALTGSVLLVYADLIGRLLFYPLEAPVGLITAFIGAPFFIVLMRMRGRKRS
ncbi:iron ABC transporter permease [Paenibacillus polysaccharolyticus]|uniref:FecCD family ABC transporter permease n=1 Tax=Paenibacillus polysaccharolyticus TaxID=582692 RepID=UPI00203C2EE6|nr:iron ABC transporter permease [Paenibacillus polysaccharolyticus]MCM3131305.1 iron ABC transporter permease [Paenibacillus polysaccharolyticus]